MAEQEARSAERRAWRNSVVLCVCFVFTVVKKGSFGFRIKAGFGFQPNLKPESIIVKFKFRQPEISMGRTITNPFLYIWGSVKIKA